MTTIAQCRAARGLLGWTQQDLADASGLSKTAINNFEKGHSDIKAESLRAIRMAFESLGIEFIGDEGLRKRSENVQILKGPAAFNDLLDDIYETLKDRGGEVLMSNVSERTTSQSEPKKLLEYLDRLRTHQISERILCPEGAQTILGSTDSCRWIPHNGFNDSLATFVYGHKIALQLWDQTMIIIVSSQTSSDVARSQFEQLWATAPASSKGEAKSSKTSIA